ncbi:MAG TPA: hypothetical protein VGR35_12110 [Tepidisphaeraceae bacterium]|nr:hypothetical protein [Tepidisphaeraceae bacterium]
MTVKLKPEHERYVRELVQAGRFPDEHAVVDAVLTAFRINDEPIPDIPGGVPWTEERLRAAVQVGIDEADRGECAEWDIEEIRAEGRRLLEERKNRRG